MGNPRAEDYNLKEIVSESGGVYTCKGCTGNEWIIMLVRKSKGDGIYKPYTEPVWRAIGLGSIHDIRRQTLTKCLEFIAKAEQQVWNLYKPKEIPLGKGCFGLQEFIKVNRRTYTGISSLDGIWRISDTRERCPDSTDWTNYRWRAVIRTDTYQTSVYSKTLIGLMKKVKYYENKRIRKLKDSWISKVDERFPAEAKLWDKIMLNSELPMTPNPVSRIYTEGILDDLRLYNMHDAIVTARFHALRNLYEPQEGYDVPQGIMDYPDRILSINPMTKPTEPLHILNAYRAAMEGIKPNRTSIITGRTETPQPIDVSISMNFQIPPKEIEPMKTITTAEMAANRRECINKNKPVFDEWLKNGTKVWVKPLDDEPAWLLKSEPQWGLINCHYVLDDNRAEIKMAVLDGKKVMRVCKCGQNHNYIVKTLRDVDDYSMFDMYIVDEFKKFKDALGNGRTVMRKCYSPFCSKQEHSCDLSDLKGNPKDFRIVHRWYEKLDGTAEKAVLCRVWDNDNDKRYNRHYFIKSYDAMSDYKFQVLTEGIENSITWKHAVPVTKDILQDFQMK